MPKIGEIYNKKYELQELVGGGNYSEVYKAKEIKSGEIVAIKIIDVAQTVLREGKIYDAISNAKLSDGITPLLDKDNKNKVPEYFVFPYREAGSLSGRIKNLDYDLKISYSIMPYLGFLWILQVYYQLHCLIHLFYYYLCHNLQFYISLKIQQLMVNQHSLNQ